MASSAAAGPPPADIRFEGVSKAFGDHRVLVDLDVQIRTGAVTALLGPNGSGKTTALRILLGLERPDAGRALIAGRRYRDLRFPMRTVGALLDATWVHPDRSARAHLTWIAQATGLPTSVVAPALAEVGLADVADSAVGTFSLGMHQRLGIASTILGDPAVLVYDEPLNGLDQQGVEWVRDFFARQAAQGRTVLLTTHMLDEVQLAADEVVVIGRGSVLYAGPTAQLYGAGDDAVVDVDLVDDPAVEPVLAEVCDDRGWQLRARPRRRGLRPFEIRGAGADADAVAAALSARGLPVRRIEQGGSLADAYVRLTDPHADHIGATRP